MHSLTSQEVPSMRLKTFAVLSGRGVSLGQSREELAEGILPSAQREWTFGSRQ